MCLDVGSWDCEGMGETSWFYNTEKVVSQKKKLKANLCYSALSFQTENRNSIGKTVACPLQTG